jgi:hypothetical protein
MSTQATIEQRLATLEADVARLKLLVTQSARATNWLDQVAGSMEHEPAFEEVLRLGREIRQADRPPDEGP